VKVLVRLTINEVDHVERKVSKYKNHKLRERKVKTPGWIILICKKMHMKLTFKTNYFISTRKHTETVSRYFDR